MIALQPQNEVTDVLHCPPIDGNALLGFLAAVGALRLLSLNPATAAARLAFSKTDGHARFWCPGLSAARLREVLVAQMTDGTVQSRWTFRNTDTNTIFEEYSDLGPVDIERLWRGAKTRLDFDILNSLFAVGDDKTASTELRAVGSGQQKFLKQIHAMTQQISKGYDVTADLDGPWEHTDKSSGLRLTPEEDRAYALRAEDPGGGASGQLGANVLSVWALSMLPVFPRGGTVGYSANRHEKVFTWCLWDDFLALPTVQAVLRIDHRLDSSKHQAAGVFRVLSATRANRGKYRNFVAPLAIW